MDVVAVVRAGSTPPGAPDDLTPVAGVPMVVRAVRGLLACGSVDGAVVVTSASRVDAVRDALGGLPVTVQADPAAPVLPARSRPGMVDRLSGGGSGPERLVVLVHDVARPLAPPSVGVAVLAAARAGHAVTVPVLPLTDTVKRVDPGGLVRDTPDRSGLRVVQTPQAFRADLVGDALPAVLAAPAGQSYAAAGTVAHTVAGHPHALALRGAWDLWTAERILAGGSA